MVESGLSTSPSQNLERIRIPLPPLPTQQAIVAELEAEQTLVDANGQLIERMEQENSGRHRTGMG